MKEPEYYENGQCKECAGRGLCEYHQEETGRKWLAKEQMLDEVAKDKILFYP